MLDLTLDIHKRSLEESQDYQDTKYEKFIPASIVRKQTLNSYKLMMRSMHDQCSP